MVAQPGSEPNRSRLGVERHHGPVIVDAILTERRELDQEVDSGQKLLSEAGEHVFVKLGRRPDGQQAGATDVARARLARWST